MLLNIFLEDLLCLFCLFLLHLLALELEQLGLPDNRVTYQTCVALYCQQVSGLRHISVRSTFY